MQAIQTAEVNVESNAESVVGASAVVAKIEATLPTTIPLSKLVMSKHNVRKTAPSGIEGLAANIEANKLLQNLIVHVQKSRKKGGEYGVAGGQRRLLALRLLEKQGKIDADYPVRVVIISEADAVIMSLSENVAREGMNPADQFDAFMTLAKAGHSVEHIAAVFGVSAITVQRRLKLANASPKLRELLRTGEITVEQLSALSLTDDHEIQERVWENAAHSWQQEPSQLRSVIANEKVQIRSSGIAKFVGLAEFEAAGGIVLRDLFADDDDEAYIENGELLQSLAAAKLDSACAQVIADGWKWAEPHVSLDWSTRSSFGRAQEQDREPTEEERIALDSLNARREPLQAQIDASDRLTNGDSDEDDALPADAKELTEDEYYEINRQIEAIEAEIGKIEANMKVWSDAIKASAGALVSVSNGKLSIEYGFVKREDRALAAAASGQTEDDTTMRFSEPEKIKAIHSEKLMMSLTAHHTAAVQAEVMQNTSVGIAVLAHRMVEGLLFPGYFESPVKVQPNAIDHRLAHVDGMKEGAAWKVIEAETKKWKAKMPKSADARFKWLLTQPQDEIAALLAFCTALTLDGIRGTDSHHPLGVVSKAVDLDMANYWTPTAELYFNHVSKSRIAEVVTQAVSRRAGEDVAAMKKGDAAQAAERLIRDAGSKWLPATFKGKTEKVSAGKDPKPSQPPKVETPAASVSPLVQPEAPANRAAWPWPTSATVAAGSERLAA